MKRESSKPNGAKQDNAKRLRTEENQNMRGKQGRKDNRQKRINFDNERKSTFLRDFEKAMAERKSSHNDFSWYAQNPELIDAAARIPFSYVIGSQFPALSEAAIPGVMSLTWSVALGNRPSNGASADAVSPVNKAANDYYSFVVHANSRNTSYTAPDLMMLTLGVGEVFSAITLGVRAYGLMRYYEGSNLYAPNALLTASGFNADDLRKNYSHMWFDINNLIAQVNTMWIPDDLPFIRRRVWLNSNVYRDAEGAKAQMYIFKPYTFYSYNETGSATGGKLVAVTGDYVTNMYVAEVNDMTWDQYLTYVQSMIDALNQSEDRGIIMGDILKAYGDSRLMKYQSIPIDYTTVPTYDPSVLMQIENATIQPATTRSIEQSDDLIYARAANIIPKSNVELVSNQFSLFFGLGRSVLNVHQPEQPTIEQVTEMTRLHSVGAWTQDVTDTGSIYPRYPEYVGTEFISVGRIWYYNFVAGSAELSSTKFQSLMPLNTSNTALNNAASGALGLPGGDMQISEFITRYITFDWAPIIYRLYSSSSISIFETDAKVGLVDADNITVVDKETLRRLNQACLFSEFGLGTRK